MKVEKDPDFGSSKRGSVSKRGRASKRGNSQEGERI